MTPLGGSHRGVFFAGRAETSYERAAFEGDLDRWARGFEGKGHEAEIFYANGAALASGRATQAATREALANAVRRHAGELDEDDSLWVVLGNHGDQEGDDAGHRRGVCTSLSSDFVSAAEIQSAIEGSKGVVVVVAGHCGAGQFGVLASGTQRVVVAAGCSRDQYAPVRAGYLEFLLWLGVPLFGALGEDLGALAPRLASSLSADRWGSFSLAEAFHFVDRYIPSRSVSGEMYAPPREQQLVQCTPALCDPNKLAGRIRL